MLRNFRATQARREKATRMKIIVIIKTLFSHRDGERTRRAFRSSPTHHYLAATQGCPGYVI